MVKCEATAVPRAACVKPRAQRGRQLRTIGGNYLRHQSIIRAYWRRAFPVLGYLPAEAIKKK